MKSCASRDGQLEEDEELQLRFIAKSYAICENSIAVLSNLRTNKSHIYYERRATFWDSNHPAVMRR